MKKILIWAMMLTSIIYVSCAKSEVGDEDKLGSIYGIVTKLGTAEPMKAVGVELYKKGTSSSKDALLLKTVTFDDGHFEFKDLNPGVSVSYKVNLECSYQSTWMLIPSVVDGKLEWNVTEPKDKRCSDNYPLKLKDK